MGDGSAKTPALTGKYKGLDRTFVRSVPSTYPMIADDAHANQLLWPDAKLGPWIITATWGVVGGRWECVGLEVRSVREAGEDWARHIATRETGGVAVTAETWRSVPVGWIVAELRKQHLAAHQRFLREVRKNAADVAEAAQRPVADQMVELFQNAEVAWTAPSGKVSAMLAETAAVYTAAWQAGKPPTKAVEFHFDIGPTAAAARVSRARQAGLLPKTRPGKAQGGRG
jgi:hypothetical protein